MRHIYKIKIDKKDREDEVSVDIYYGNGKQKTLKEMEMLELRSGWILRSKKTNTTSDDCRGCIIGLFKSFFHI